MKLNPTLFIAIAALSVSGGASAAYTTGNASGGSSLILSVYDTNPAAPNSFSELLDPLTFGTFDPTQSHTFALSATNLTTFQSLFNGANASDIHWSVVAVSNQPGSPSSATPSLQMLTAPVDPQTQLGSAFYQGNQLVPTTTKFNSYITNLSNNNNGAGVSSTSTLTDVINMAPGGGSPFQGDRGAQSIPFDIFGPLGGSLNFYNAAVTGQFASSHATFTQDAGFWTLANNGTLTWTVAAVPEPTTAVFFSLGLMGVLGLVKLRNRGQL
jgi:hypothetical protein